MSSNSAKSSAQKLVLIPYKVYTQTIMESVDGHHPMVERMEGVVAGTEEEEDSISKLINSTKDNKNIVKIMSAVNRMPIVDTQEYEQVDESQQLNGSAMNILPVAANISMMSASASSVDHLTGNDVEILDTPKNRELMPTLRVILRRLDEQFGNFGIRLRRSTAILNWILGNNRVTIDPHTQTFVIDKSVESAIKVVDFLYSLQTPLKKIDDSYVDFIRLMKIPKSLMVNVKGVFAASTNLKTAATTAIEDANNALTLGAPSAHSTPLKATTQHGSGTTSRNTTIGKGHAETQRLVKEWVKAF